ncbi:MAG: heme o synthase, partial [Phycisphaerales bacterium]|nr:heme o synthase [Phycisphaerales bacterium]
MTSTSHDPALAAPRPGVWRQYAELTKARLSTLVVVTTAIGFVMGSIGAVDWLRLLWTVVGTGLCAGCASGLNQAIEHRRDACMPRTRHRPVPSGAMSLRHAALASAVMGYVGLTMLGVLVNLGAAALAALTIAVYVLVYTPMKTRSTMNTLIGAVVGAIPPMIGWVGAAGEIGPGAWILATILFIWQLPHFLALAWMYRDDYALGGFRMLPMHDPSGEITSRVAVLTSLLLLPVSLAAVLVGLAGLFYAIAAVLLAGWMALLAWRFHARR